MAAKVRKGAGKGVLKKTALSVLAGLAFCLVLSLAASAVTARAENALSLETAAAALCVLGGALLAAALGVRLTGAVPCGLCSGVAFTAVLLLLSLCVSEGGSCPLPLFAAAAGGVLTGALIFGKRGSGRKKRLGKYIKRT